MLKHDTLAESNTNFSNKINRFDEKKKQKRWNKAFGTKLIICLETKYKALYTFEICIDVQQITGGIVVCGIVPSENHFQE